MKIKKYLIAFMLILAGLYFRDLNPAESQAVNNVQYSVNDQIITAYDIHRRAAFLKLSGAKGVSAENEMINQALKLSAMKKMKINITNNQIDMAYISFVRSNNMTVPQFDNILKESGVTKEHFKQYIRTQMGWNYIIDKKAQKGLSGININPSSLDKINNKPTAIEYTLQRIIFIIPQKNKNSSLIARRKAKAESIRKRFVNCSKTMETLKGIKDVSIADMGRFLEFSLPDAWRQSIKNAYKKGEKTTTIQETRHMIEFISICKTERVSDDRVYDMIKLQKNKSNDEDISLNYLKDLRKKAKIIKH